MTQFFAATVELTSFYEVEPPFEGAFRPESSPIWGMGMDPLCLQLVETAAGVLGVFALSIRTHSGLDQQTHRRQ